MSGSDERAAGEHEIRALCEAHEQQAAATQLIELYGCEILGFLISRLCDHDAAGEVFSRFTEDMWRGLDGFRWQCSARVWCYTLARHAASHYIREARRRRVKPVPRRGERRRVRETVGLAARRRRAGGPRASTTRWVDR